MACTQYAWLEKSASSPSTLTTWAQCIFIGLQHPMCRLLACISLCPRLSQIGDACQKSAHGVLQTNKYALCLSALLYCCSQSSDTGLVPLSHSTGCIHLTCFKAVTVTNNIQSFCSSQAIVDKPVYASVIRLRLVHAVVHCRPKRS